MEQCQHGGLADVLRGTRGVSNVKDTHYFAWITEGGELAQMLYIKGLNPSCPSEPIIAGAPHGFVSSIGLVTLTTWTSIHLARSITASIPNTLSMYVRRGEISRYLYH